MELEIIWQLGGERVELKKCHNRHFHIIKQLSGKVTSSTRPEKETLASPTFLKKERSKDIVRAVMNLEAPPLVTHLYN